MQAASCEQEHEVADDFDTWAGTSFPLNTSPQRGTPASSFPHPHMTYLCELKWSQCIWTSDTVDLTVSGIKMGEFPLASPRSGTPVFDDFDLFSYLT